jgi:UbiD family decarboxylase
MNRLGSMREYVKQLKAIGEFQELDAEVDWDLEMGAIIRRCSELQALAPLFNRVNGIEPGFRVLGAPDRCDIIRVKRPRLPEVKR